MDDRHGQFIQADTMEQLREKQEQMSRPDLPPVDVSLKEGRIFYKGEIVTVKGSVFKVANIMRHTLVLQLMPEEYRPKVDAAEEKA
jgi:hypothetical protein